MCFSAEWRHWRCQWETKGLAAEGVAEAADSLTIVGCCQFREARSE
jgi:hypothetical protein